MKRLIFQYRNVIGATEFYKVELTKNIEKIIKTSEKLNHDINILKPFDIGLSTALHTGFNYNWTYHSNALEGNRLSYSDTIFFLQEELTVDGKFLKDFIDTLNHLEIINKLNTFDLTPESMKLINKFLLKRYEVFSDFISPGRYRKNSNFIYLGDHSKHFFVDPDEVEPEMNYLFERINQNIYHPIITSSIAHYNMTRIHPFVDGNGRGSRILMNMILSKKGYSKAIVKVKDRKKYLKYLRLADNGNLSPFIEFIGNCVIESQRETIYEASKYKMIFK